LDPRSKSIDEAVRQPFTILSYFVSRLSRMGGPRNIGRSRIDR
jgi:hypothetical protein